jgi:hypothetical protein
MKHLKLFEGFNPYDDEPLTSFEQRFGKKTRLEKQFSNIVVPGLCSDDDNICMYWSTFTALESQLENVCDEVTLNELKHRVVEGENPTEVMSDICSRLEQNEEMKRLLNKLNSF